MRKLLLFFIAIAVGFVSCSKKLDEKNTDHSETVTTLEGIQVPAGFDWSTTKTINVQINLPEAEGIKRTKITSVDGSVTYFKGYPSDTTERVLETRITVPAYMEVLKVSNGINEDYVDINGSSLNADFNNISKSLKSTNANCGECDGQITHLTLEYLGSLNNPMVKVVQHNGDVIFEGNVSEAFSFIGTRNKNKMGPKIHLYVNNEYHIEIHTSCSVTILAGQVWGDFLIVEGISSNGGALCQIEEDEPESFAGTVIYEDLYPSKGDYDFNDLVIEYNYQINKGDDNFVESVDATFVVKAFGASFHNAFGFQFPDVLPSDVASVTGGVFKNNTIFNMAANGVESDQSKATFIVYDDAYDILQHPGNGIGVNTSPEASYVEPVSLNLNIVFENDAVSFEDLNIGNFNPFIVMKQDRDFEVHLANYEPTDLFNTNMFGTFDDDSNPGNDVYFVTENNLPWAINIPEGFNYMKEKAEISTGYLHFVQWAESGGTLYQDWYLEAPGYINSSQLYPIP